MQRDGSEKGVARKFRIRHAWNDLEESVTVTLITGTSSGIGQAAAVHFARKGHRVFASMRDPDRGGDPLRDAARAEKLHVELLRIDVNDGQSVERGVASVLDAAGHIDVLINNAGIGGGGPFEETSDDVWHALMETNFHGAVRMTRAVLPGMRARQSGAIVQVTSTGGRVAAAPAGPYAASKFALEAASEVLAQEVRRFGIRVVIVEPGVILTPIFLKVRREPDLTSPYADFVVRAGRFFLAQLQDAKPPGLVAEVIDEALDADPPRLRWPVGPYAKEMINGRQAMTDEEWVDIGRPMTEEELVSVGHKLLGVAIE
jgi:NAD(P)-dependent dehydrogenase (short-subunit alcohol dehydrogenase family)